MKKLLFIALCLLLPVCRAPAAEDTGTLIVDLDGFHNDAGAVRVILFRGKDGFPKDYTKAYQVITSSITNHRIPFI